MQMPEIIAQWDTNGHGVTYRLEGGRITGAVTLTPATHTDAEGRPVVHFVVTTPDDEPLTVHGVRLSRFQHVHMAGALPSPLGSTYRCWRVQADGLIVEAPEATRVRVGSLVECLAILASNAPDWSSRVAAAQVVEATTCLHTERMLHDEAVEALAVAQREMQERAGRIRCYEALLSA